MSHVVRFVASLQFLSILAACNVDDAPASTGGVDLQAGPCGRGLIVVSTDYQSTNVSLVSLDGLVLSRSFVSSALSDVGLSAPLGGDVVLPTQRQDGDDILLLDRYPASVLTWVDVQTGTPSGQLSLASGFAANPHDVLVLAEHKAYATRSEPNFDPGHEPFDQGDDIVIIDPMARTLTGRIDLHPAMIGAGEGFYARPDKIIAEGERVFLLLGGYAPDYLSSAPSRVATINPGTDSVADVVVLEDMHGCVSIDVSPSRHEIAVACAGEFGGDSVSTIAESGVVLLSTHGTLTERRRFPAAKFGLGPLAAAAYVGDTSLLLTTFGQFEEGDEPERQDGLVQLNTDSGEFEVLMRSESSPFSLGDVRCAPACNVCFLADAERGGGVLHRLTLEDEKVRAREQIVVDREIGLPPRSLGWF
jgi:hypothetical protein